MVIGVFNIFFPQFGVRGALNFDNCPKRYSETRQTGVKILLESKLLILVFSNMAQKNVKDLYFINYEFIKKCFANRGA